MYQHSVLAPFLCNYAEYEPAPFEPQPENFTQESGDRNVFVPCPYGGPATPSWKIGKHFYTFSTLPNNFIQVASGLIIKEIISNMTGLSFQCFSPSGKGLFVDKSSVGVLRVPEYTEKIEDSYYYGKLHKLRCDTPLLTTLTWALRNTVMHKRSMYVPGS